MLEKLLFTYQLHGCSSYCSRPKFSNRSFHTTMWMTFCSVALALVAVLLLTEGMQHLWYNMNQAEGGPGAMWGNVNTNPMKDGMGCNMFG